MKLEDVREKCEGCVNLDGCNEVLVLVRPSVPWRKLLGGVVDAGDTDEHKLSQLASVTVESKLTAKEAWTVCVRFCMLTTARARVL